MPSHVSLRESPAAGVMSSTAMDIRVTISEGAACAVMFAACQMFTVRRNGEAFLNVARGRCKAEAGRDEVPRRPLAKGALPCTVHVPIAVRSG